MKVSVVLSTYNGDKYIVELLDSLRLQSYIIDEVLISDDCSSDDTINIIKNYIKFYDLKNWFLIINKKNLGWKKNFYNLILKASGDLIFPCDQDDIWKKNKIEKCVNAMKKESEALLFCSDYEMFYMNGSTLFPKTKISKISNSKKIEKLNPYKSLQVVDRPGCTYCIKKELIPIMKELYFEEVPHDALAWRSAAICNSIFILHEKLILFRRHEANASDIQRNTIEDRIELAIYYIKTWKQCIKFDNEKKYIKLNLYIYKSLLAQTNRLNALKNKSIVKWMLNIKYINYLPSVKTYVYDGVLILKNKRR